MITFGTFLVLIKTSIILQLIDHVPLRRLFIPYPGKIMIVSKSAMFPVVITSQSHCRGKEKPTANSNSRSCLRLLNCNYVGRGYNISNVP
jgi:hypothetical protein